MVSWRQMIENSLKEEIQEKKGRFTCFSTTKRLNPKCYIHVTLDKIH